MRSSIWRKPEPSNTHLKNKFFGKSEKQPFFSPNTIQPKLTIGAPNDKYEQEADAMADKVVSQPNSAVGNVQNGSPAIQTKCAGCAGEKEKGVQRMGMEEEEGAVQRMEEEETPAIQQMSEEEEGGGSVQKMGEEEEGDSVQRMVEEEQEGAVQRMEEEEGSVQTKLLMRKATNGGGVATSNLSTQLNNSKGNGHGLSKSTNQYMSQAFGRDFSQVRIHTDNRSVEMNKGIQAKAFTHGKDIYFNNGQYDPNSTKGKRLLAHELTHVVQQGGGKKNKNIQKAPETSSSQGNVVSKKSIDEENENFDFEASVERNQLNEESSIGDEVLLPDIIFSPNESFEHHHDAVKGEINYTSQTSNAGATPSGFGVTVPSHEIKNIRVKKRKKDYLIRFNYNMKMDWQVRNTTGPTGQKDIKNKLSKHITKANYKNVISDLTPNMSDLNGRPPRNDFWSKQLTITHEKFHARDAVKLGSQGAVLTRNWLNGRSASSIADCNILVADSGQRIWQAMMSGMATPGREERAYGDGATRYKTLAAEIKKRGNAKKYS